MLYNSALHGVRQPQETSENLAGHREEAQSAAPPPEARLYFAMLGAPCIPISLFRIAYAIVAAFANMFSLNATFSSRLCTLNHWILELIY